MKKLLVFIAILGGLLFIFTFKTSSGNYLVSYSACDEPLTYRIGSVDPRFNLTTDAALQNANEAAATWNQVAGKKIFIESATARVTINLVYDLRQKLSTEVNQLQKKIDTDKDTLDPQIIDFNNRSAALEKKLTEFNAEVAYWNSQGGAPKTEYDKLQERQSELQQESDALNNSAKNLNQSTRAYNTQIQDLTKTQDTLSQTLTFRPEEGVYDGSTDIITIYFNNTKDELVHTMAHELGHARGIDHNNNPDSIMYASSTDSRVPTANDKEALTTVCRSRSYPELIITGYVNFIQQVVQKLKR